MAVGVKIIGLGGAIEVQFKCTGCTFRNVTFKSSLLVEQSRRTVVGLALCVAFIISGRMYADYFKTLSKALGIATVTKKNFYYVIKLMYPAVKELLDGTTEDAKEYTKGKDKDKLGS